MKKILRFAILAMSSISITSCTYYQKARDYHDVKRTHLVVEQELFDPARLPVRPETPDRRNIEVRLKDGNILRGLLIPRLEPVANIIYFGGSKELAQVATTRSMAWAARFNVNVFFVDYRGYGASSGLPALRNLPGDALEVYDGLRGSLGELPTFIIGFSIGSIPATHLAVHRPVAGLVLMAPISGFEDRDMYPQKRLRKEIPRYFAPLEKWIKVKADFEIPENFEPITQILNVNAPLMLIHGEDDDIVPVICGKKIFKLAPGDKSLFLIPNVGHEELTLLENPVAEGFAGFMFFCLSSDRGDSNATVITEVIVGINENDET